MMYLGDTAVGVATREIGSFKRYGTATATPTTNGREMTFTNPLGETPKLVIIESSTEADQKVKYLVLTPVCGACEYNGRSDTSIYMYQQVTGATTQNYTLSANSIYVTRYSASVLLDANSTYTAYIYA